MASKCILIKILPLCRIIWLLSFSYFPEAHPAWHIILLCGWFVAFSWPFSSVVWSFDQGNRPLVGTAAPLEDKYRLAVKREPGYWLLPLGRKPMHSASRVLCQVLGVVVWLVGHQVSRSGNLNKPQSPYIDRLEFEAHLVTYFIAEKDILFLVNQPSFFLLKPGWPAIE